MSGPIVPPLQVTEVDGSPDGRPITKIIVSNGDLSISGRTATIDTTGSGGTPGGSDTQVQYNNAGAFGGSADFTFTGIGGTDPTFTITNSASDAATITQKNITLDGGTALPTISTTTGDDGLQIQTGTHGSSGPRILLDAVTSPSVLSLTNDESNGTINIETTAGTGDITVNANGDLNLYGDSDSVVLRHQSGGSVYATSATDEDAILGITSVGTGTPRLDIQSPSNRVWVLCDSNKELKVQGGSGGDTFVFDVSSATGSLTWPDGTSQSTAADSNYNVPAVALGATANFDKWNIATQWQTATYAALNLTSEFQFFSPFIAPVTGAPTACSVYVNSASTADSLYVGFYSATNGAPATMLGYATIDTSSTGGARVTSFTEASTGSLTFTRSSQYWYSINKDGTDTINIASCNAAYQPSTSPDNVVNTTAEDQVNIESTASTTDPPANVAITAIQGSGGGGDMRAWVWLEF